MRKIVLLALLATAIAGLSAPRATAKPPGPNGKIRINGDNVSGQEQVYTVDPDGTDLRLLVNDAEAGQWSPDGMRIPYNGGIVNFDIGGFTDLSLDTRYPGMFLGCGVWSPDGARLACEGLSDANPTVNGIYTVRSADGADLQRITADEFGDDCPGDYSPNGKRLVFIRANDAVFALFVTKLDATVRDERGRPMRGGDLTQITPSGMELNFDCGSWSPQGNQILFSAHVPNGDYRSTVWAVNSDGSNMHQVPIPGCGGLNSSPTSISCRYAAWSPDGTKVVFSRFTAATGQRDLYTVNADGTGLFQVTNTPGIDEFGSDWGTHPVTP
jgi:hypothetical protein